jgi:type IV pilus assembly protein PilB
MFDNHKKERTLQPITHSRLGELLVRSGMLSDEQLSVALAVQRSSLDPKPRLGAVIVEQGFASDESIAHALARQMGLEYIELENVAPEPDVLRLLPRKIAAQHLLVPVALTPDRLVVAMADPSNLTAIDDVKASTGIGRFELRVGSMSAIRDAIDRFYSVDMAAVDALSRLGITGEVEILPEEAEDEDDEALQRDSQTAPIVRLVNAILGDALRGGATDIHIEPHPTAVKVRYRVDGLLRDVMILPKHIQALVVSRLKIISGMDIAERRRPQDGRSKFLIDGKEIDTRVSTMPTMSGEKIVIRLLHKSEESVSLERLGLEPEQDILLRNHLLAPQGLVVFTGPTGAGKTSTMYAALGFVRGAEKNLVTLEDPIEFQIDGMNQVQIDERAGVTFARGLRSILRQDPDVIMVGEIRDLETAQMVLQASFTGHMVLSSLHTKDAPSALTRLADLGVEPFRIGSAVSLLVAQRLVRVICEKCKVPTEIKADHLEQLGLAREDVAGFDTFEGAGCEACDDTGYHGRTGIFELLPVTPPLRERIAAGVNDQLVSQLARSQGMSTLLENGLRKVRAGITTLDELHRVLQVERSGLPQCPICRRHILVSSQSCPHCAADLSGDGTLEVEIPDLKIVERGA